MSMRKRVRAIEAVIAKHCEDYDVIPTKNHISVLLRHNGTERRLSTSGSPSDGNAIRQFERDVKKAMWELTEGLPPGTAWS